MKKGMMFCGKDSNNIVRAVAVDANGVLQSQNESTPYAYVTDDDQHKVLKVVDAAPYLLEYGQYTSMSSDSYEIGAGATSVLSENADRKYASVFNAGNGNVVLSADTSGKGIVIPANGRYDMSVMYGNLYCGQMYVNAIPTDTEIISSFEQGGIGSDGSFSNSAKRTHTDYIAVDVPEGGLGLTVKITSDTGVIRNICAYNSSKQQTYWKGVSSFIAADGSYTEVSAIIPNTSVKYIVVSFANKASADSDYTASTDMTNTTLSIAASNPTTVYVAEGE